MTVSERLARIQEIETAIERLSERVQGMMLLGQNRDDIKQLAVALARKARTLAALCGERTVLDTRQF